MKIFALIVLLTVMAAILNAQPAANYGPLPSPRQLKWHELEYYLFTHFGPNTFTDLEWGEGTEKEEIFNPTALDCRQWCRIARAAGAKGIILTAKHHDGFCLWPSKYSTHTVKQSKWRNGKGDVLKELADACKEYGLKLGIYLSPWDRNHPQYGTAGYNEVFVNMMKEVVTRYGPLFEFWWDGANGEGPNGKMQVYDWNRFEKTLRTITPNTPIFSDIGPDIRWVGNEQGIAGETNWNLLDTAGFGRGASAPSADVLNKGNIDGKVWIPAECDVSIRPGWFYHQQEDEKVKSPEKLFELYLKSVGRGATLLLNVPPDRRGLFTSFDSAALVNFKRLRDENLGTSLTRHKGIRIITGSDNKDTRLLTDGDNRTFISLGSDYAGNAVEITFTEPTPVNCVLLQEPIQMGQRIKSFTIQVITKEGAAYEVKKSTIGHKRIVSFPVQSAVRVITTVTDVKAMPLLSEVQLFKMDDALVEKE